jgi:putative transposase
MKKSRHSEEKIIAAVKQMEGGRKTGDVARELGVSAATLYAWKNKYAGMQVNDAKRLRQLEEENRRLKHMVADLSLDKEAMKAIIAKNGWSS